MDVPPSVDAGGADAGVVDAGTPEAPPVCTPPALLDLAAIPDDPSLDDGDTDTLAIFEVDGHALIGKHVEDPAAALGGLRLWQEVMLRIPENQLRDLVQLEFYSDTDPVAYFNRRGAVTTQRYGLKLGFSTKNFDLNDPDPCAPLVPRRGNFDWSLIHEFGHLRGWVDESWDRFLETFPDRRGSGEGYPEDGSPMLDGEFVTSYAERADGDEDHAESWTTFVMLPETVIGAPQPNEPLAISKVRWMSEQPGYRELRRAIRVTEADGSNAPIAPAPRLRDRFDVDIRVPAFLHGTWRGTVDEGEGTYEQQFTFTADDVVETRFVDGVESYTRSARTLFDDGVLIRFEVNFQQVNGYGYNATLFPTHVDEPLEDSFIVDGERALWTRLGGPNDAVLTRR